MKLLVIVDGPRVDTLAFLQALDAQEDVVATVTQGQDVEVPEGVTRVWVRARPAGIADATLLERGDILLDARLDRGLDEASPLRALAALLPTIPGLHTRAFRAAAALGVDPRAALRGESGGDPGDALQVAVEALANPILAVAEARRPYAAGETLQMLPFYRAALRAQAPRNVGGVRLWDRRDAGDEAPILDVVLALEGGYAVTRDAAGALAVRGYASPELAASLLAAVGDAAPAATPVETPAASPVETPAATPVETPAASPVETPAPRPSWWMAPALCCTIAATSEAEARALLAVHAESGAATPDLLATTPLFAIGPLDDADLAAERVEVDLPIEFYALLDELRAHAPLDAGGSRFVDCMADAVDVRLADGTVQALLGGRAPRAQGRNAHLAGSLAHVDLLRDGVKIAQAFPAGLPLALAIPALEALGCRFADTPR